MPEFYCNIKENKKLITLIRQYPEIIQDQTEIYGFYGNFPYCIWNGGRVIEGNFCLKEQMQEIFDLYNNELKLPIRLTFTNPLIQEKECYDTYANLIASIGHNGKNEILVNSPILEKYLKENYPNYKYCRSITASSYEQPFNTNYYMTVLNKCYINNFDKLSQINDEDRKKIEILCNDPCIDNCPIEKEHYQNIGQAILNFSTTKQASCKMRIFEKDTIFFMYEQQKKQKYVSKNMIINQYLPLGYQYFKLSGREDYRNRIINWKDYIIKPEYHNDLIKIIL